MNDLVERLREVAVHTKTSKVCMANLIDAADEIERLQAKLAEANMKIEAYKIRPRGKSVLMEELAVLTQVREPVAWYWADGEGICFSATKPNRELCVPLFTSTTPTDRDAWQPIGTAPKDATQILLAGEFDFDGDWRIKIGYWSLHDNDWYIFGGSWPPTHWMPLPAPPGHPSHPSQPSQPSEDAIIKLRQFVANDVIAVTYQSLGQYRSALLKRIVALQEGK